MSRSSVPPDTSSDPAEAAWVGAHLARYESGLGNHDAAIRLAREAVDLLDGDVSYHIADRNLRKQLLARLLVRGGHAAEALDSVPPPEEPPFVLEGFRIRVAALRSLCGESGGHATGSECETDYLTRLTEGGSLLPGLRGELALLVAH